MARFVFKLQAVLDHRERVEDDRQRELAVVRAEMTRMENELREITEQVRGSAADVRDNHLVGRLNMAYLAAHRRYMLGMQRKVQTLARAMAAQQQLVDRARAALVEATKRKKILEKLRDRHRERWSADIARADAAAFDELATQLSHRDLLARAGEES